MTQSADPTYMTHYDLVSPDGYLTKLERVEPRRAVGTVLIEHISPRFVGFEIPKDRVFFNFKSTLAQLGLNSELKELHLESSRFRAEAKLEILAYGRLGEQMLNYLQEGSSIGKLFAADERRRVRHPHYLSRMFGRSDRKGRPLLALGGLQGSGDLILEEVDGRTVAYLALQKGVVHYKKGIEGFLPTVGETLRAGMAIRDYLHLHQELMENETRIVHPGEMLLVRTAPLYIRTVFGRVVDELLPEGYKHTAASVLEPHTHASGDIYELYGESQREISDIPLEFYTLEPYREYVFFADRDQLQVSLEKPDVLFDACETAPKPLHLKTAVFIAKGKQLKNLKAEDWVACEPVTHELPGLSHSSRQGVLVERYIEQQPAYPFLKNIESNVITSQGILLCRYFPSPFMKRMLLADSVQRCLKGLYFQYPSLAHGDFFSYEDRFLLHDLHQFAIPVFWLDQTTKRILQYLEQTGKGSGMFVPIDKAKMFLDATIFGIYGSNLIAGDFEQELHKLLAALLQMRGTVQSPLLGAKTPLALVTGGGPGAMELGNRIAMDLGILSCGNIVDFKTRGGGAVNEQKQNPYVEAKMTYRLDNLVERQAEFHLNFPIFVEGGMGTDFELSLEEVRRKTGAAEATPILLFGENEYWASKITSRFTCNLEKKTIQGSEWVSNCFYCVQTAEQGLLVYRKFLENSLSIGKHGRVYLEGFVPSTKLNTI